MNEFLNELKEIILSYGAQIIFAIVTALLGVALNWVKNFVKERIKDDAVKQAVRYVEQIYEGVSSSEKYEAALKAVSDKLKIYGITVNEDEMKVQIEAAVNEFFAHVNDKEISE